MQILGGTPAQLYTHNLVAAELWQMFVPELKVCPDASCVSLLRGKHNADCRASMEHLETTILRNRDLSVLMVESTPCFSSLLSSHKVVYWSY